MSYYIGDDITEVISIKRGKKTTRHMKPASNESIYWQSSECATPLEVRFYRMSKKRPESELKVSQCAPY